MTKRVCNLIMAVKPSVDREAESRGALLTQDAVLYAVTMATQALRLMAAHKDRDSILDELHEDTRANTTDAAEFERGAAKI